MVHLSMNQVSKHIKVFSSWCRGAQLFLSVDHINCTLLCAPRAQSHKVSHKGLFKAKKLAFVAGRMLPPPVSNKRPAKVTLMDLICVFNLNLAYELQ